MTVILNWAFDFNRRLHRAKRHAMKKQATTRNKTTSRARSDKRDAVKWHDHARGLPLVLLHTTVGPIIGRAEKAPKNEFSAAFSLRVWAPAAVRMGFEPGQPGVLDQQYAVTFQPIAFVETYIDLSVVSPFGQSPVPDVMVAAYEQYFAKTAAGDYQFNRVVERVQQAKPHSASVEASDAAKDATTQEPEPAKEAFDDENDARPVDDPDDDESRVS